jgi:anti-sigma factor RsiW
MKCEDYQEWISQYLDRELDDKTSRELFLHLGTCTDCRGFLHSLLLLRDSMRGETAPTAPGSLDARMKNIASRKGSQMARDRRAISHFLGKRISVSVTAAMFVLMALIASSAFLATTFFTEPQIVEKKVQETIYIVQLPQVEVKGYYPTTTKSN